MKMNHIYVTNHTYVQFKVAKKRLSGLLMLLLFFYFLFCIGASFLIIIISQYCGHQSKQEVNYMGVCLCHCVTIFFTARHYIWFTQCLISRELNKVTKRVRIPLREGNQTEMAGTRIDIKDNDVMKTKKGYEEITDDST